MATLSPSALNLLAKCRCAVPGVAAEARRGTLIHAAIRDAWDKFNVPVLFGDIGVADELTSADREAVAWAVEQLAAVEQSAGAPVYTEYGCATVGGCGCMDAYCPAARIVIDYKTGTRDDYRPQMAAYAAYCMQVNGVTEWDADVLYVDLQTIERYHFTLAEALSIVRGIVDAPKVMTHGKHCKRCRAKCPHRR